MPSLGFLTAGFLAAGAAAATLPVLIHLLMRQRARTVEIGSTRFLQRVIRQHTRRRRIRQWLLLALRVAALLLLGALFARPYLDRTRLEAANREVALLIDRSASMTARGADGNSLLESAWRAAKREAQSLDENIRLHVALFDAAGVEEADLKSLDRPPVASHAATDYGEALAWARDVMTTSPRLGREVTLITDLQQSGIRNMPADFPEGVRLRIIDVGRSLAQNVAVEDARAIAVEIRPQSKVRVAATLHNTGAIAVRGLRATISLAGPQGKIAAEQTVDLAGGARQTLAFSLDVQKPGLYQGVVEIDHEDDLAIDNRRYVALEARLPDRVLLVDGEPGRSVYENETYYLETALRLSAPVGDAPPRTYEIERIIWDDGEGFPELVGFRAVVLANVGRLTSLDVRRLGEYVSGGGRLLFFAGDQTSPATFAALSAAHLSPGEAADEPLSGTLRPSAWEADHPLLTPFSDPQHGDLRRLVLRRALRWKSLDRSARPLLQVGGEPLIIEKPLGDGLALFVGTTADRGWSDWPQGRLYVPLVRQMLAYLTDQLGARRAILEKGIERPGEKAGIESSGRTLIVRNLDPQESLLARTSEDALRQRLGLPDDAASSDAAAQEASLAPPGAERADEAWRHVMWSLFAVLAVELLLASRVHG